MGGGHDDAEDVVARRHDDTVVAAEVDDVGGFVDESQIGGVGSAAGGEQPEVAGALEGHPLVHEVRGGADEVVAQVPVDPGAIMREHQRQVAGRDRGPEPEVLDVQQVQCSTFRSVHVRPLSARPAARRCREVRRGRDSPCPNGECTRPA